MVLLIKTIVVYGISCPSLSDSKIEKSELRTSKDNVP